jgi:WD40 repeat protein
MVDTPVTHLRRIESGLVIAGMDGRLDVFDLRFTPIPSLKLSNHVNSYTRDLGFDVWNDFVAAAGQDRKIRIWSLRDGVQIRSSSNPNSLVNREFDEPIKAIKLRECAGDRNDQGGRLNAKEATSSELWIANGPDLECYAID